MPFQLQNWPTYPFAAAIPITDGQTVTVGQIVRLASNRVRKALTAGSDWFGYCMSVSDGVGTGNSGGTVTAAVAVFNKVPTLVAPYASAVASGDPLDIATAANALTTNTNSDFRVVDQSADATGYQTIVQPAAGRLLCMGLPGLALTADEIAAIAGGLGTPSAAAPFATLAYTLAAIPARVYTAYGTGLASAGNITITTLTAGITPAVGDIIIGARGSVIATGVNLAAAAEPIIGTTFTAALGTAGVVAQLVNTLNANTYIFTIIRPS